MLNQVLNIKLSYWLESNHVDMLECCVWDVTWERYKMGIWMWFSHIQSQHSLYHTSSHSVSTHNTTFSLIFKPSVIFTLLQYLILFFIYYLYYVPSLPPFSLKVSPKPFWKAVDPKLKRNVQILVWQKWSSSVRLYSVPQKRGEGIHASLQMLLVGNCWFIRRNLKAAFW